MGNIMRIWHKMRKGTAEIAPILNMLKDELQTEFQPEIHLQYVNKH